VPQVRGENAKACLRRHCEERSDEAIQLSFFFAASWIASLALAMTALLFEN